MEPYADAPGGERLVQYTDKSRMEDNAHRADAPWDVTNGLLAKELLTGLMQVGDDQFIARKPADIQVAGDPDPDSPTYAMFAATMSEPATEEGTSIIATMGPDGSFTDNEFNPNNPSHRLIKSRLVIAEHYVEATDHTVASVFWSFLNASGEVYEVGDYRDAELFLNPFFATGLPITEAYWMTVPVRGEDRVVLVQCFERRCLTYTPSDPDGWPSDDGWAVEAGNIGQHYYEWRYSHDGFSCEDVEQTSVQECEALVAFYESTNGYQWKNVDGWLSDANPCNWWGITCSNAGQNASVIGLELGDNRLHGSLPPELGDLSQLEELRLTFNDPGGDTGGLSGPIPPELGNLEKLRSLSFFANQLSGSIPPELGNLENLEHLDLQANRLTGPIPPELGDISNLSFLSLAANRLDGSIPSELGNLSELELLSLESTELSGPIPPEIGHLAKLETLNLFNSQLSGPIPPELGNLDNLQELNLSANQLTGPIPHSLTNIGDLHIFWFDDTNLCEPPDTVFQEWLAGVSNVRSTEVDC